MEYSAISVVPGGRNPPAGRHLRLCRLCCPQTGQSRHKWGLQSLPDLFFVARMSLNTWSCHTSFLGARITGRCFLPLCSVISKILLLNFIWFVCVWERGREKGVCFLAQIDFRLVIPLPQLPVCADYRFVSLCEIPHWYLCLLCFALRQGLT